jgi:lipid-A-disaccharide synthase
VTRPLKIGVIAGEESGDLLAADLIRALEKASGRPVELIGVGGRHLGELGLKSLFNADDLALMGISAVLRDLPRLISRIGSTAAAIVAAKPDCLITVDSPDFTLRVAKKVRAAAPSIPIVHYVCPTVWAWRPGRAKPMKAFVDRVLCLLPFEPAELLRLEGPPGTYVGHRLSRDPGVALAATAQDAPRDLSEAREKTLLVLPGSRRSEIKALIEPFHETIALLQARGHRLRLLMPTVPHVAQLVREATGNWPVKPEITLDTDAKWRAFGQADAALAASGTVALELALCGTPLVSCYKLDPLAKLLRGLFTAWSASLPNIVADRLVVSEYIDVYLRPSIVARNLEALMADTLLRQWQKQGFEEVRRRMATDRPAGEIAAETVLDVIGKRVENSPGRE